MVRSFYNWFYQNLPIERLETDDAIHLLSEKEAAKLHSLQTKAVYAAAIIGALGVLLLYLPKYIWPYLFSKWPVDLFGQTIEIPLRFTLWSVFLVMLELMLLTLMHIYCIHQMAVATGFLTYENKPQVSFSELLLNISLEKKDKTVSRFGIDPLAGMNKYALFFWNLLIAVKATISNLVFKVLVQKMLGRYAFQWVLDLAGIPVFAAWNAWGTFQVLRQGRVVIMGQNLVEQAFKKMKEAWPTLNGQNDLVYNSLQFIAISKRDYHFNHSILTRLFVEHYQLQKPEAAFNETTYLRQLQQAPADIKQLCKWIIALGFLLDGSLSKREQKRFEQLNAIGMAPTDWDTMKTWTKAFMDGKGWEGLAFTA
jgi:hypothetical protein